MPVDDREPSVNENAFENEACNLLLYMLVDVLKYKVLSWPPMIISSSSLTTILVSSLACIRNSPGLKSGSVGKLLTRNETKYQLVDSPWPIITGVPLPA